MEQKIIGHYGNEFLENDSASISHHIIYLLHMYYIYTYVLIFIYTCAIIILNIIISAVPFFDLFVTGSLVHRFA